MINKTRTKKNKTLVILTEYIRIKDVMVWSAISFGGFILGMSHLDLSSNIIPLIVFLVSMLIPMPGGEFIAVMPLTPMFST